MEIPGLGAVTYDARFGWYQSSPIRIRVLGGVARAFIVDGYDDDPAQSDVHDAIAAFLKLDERVLRASAPSIFDYYLDVQSDVGDEVGFPLIKSAEDVWQHIVFGDVTVGRDGAAVFVSVESECSWEQEHGLQIVFRAGRAVTKVGPFDGQYTNASVGGRGGEDTVYQRWGSES